MGHRHRRLRLRLRLLSQLPRPLSVPVTVVMRDEWMRRWVVGKREPLQEPDDGGILGCLADLREADDAREADRTPPPRPPNRLPLEEPCSLAPSIGQVE